MIDRYTWDEADIKLMSLLYLSPETEATHIFHPRNLYTVIDHCSTHELVYELGLTFTTPPQSYLLQCPIDHSTTKPKRKPRDFLLSVEDLGSKAAVGNVQEDLMKYFFIAKMNNHGIQMELGSEVRTLKQVLNFALSRERGQEN